jgi:hypothetical protein
MISSTFLDETCLESSSSLKISITQALYYSLLLALNILEELGLS